MNHQPILLVASLILSCACWCQPTWAQFSLLKLKPTKLSQLPDTPELSWNLGPTGMRGWVVGANGDSKASREILVVSVEANSPAAGKLRPFDIITGVAGKPFTSDARRSFGEAIEPAESSNGILKVTRWRSGKSQEIGIKIGKLPGYGRDGGEKRRKAILQRSANYVANKMPRTGYRGFFGSFEALFLLSTGDRSYQQLITHTAQQMAKSIQAAKGKKPPQLSNWAWSHQGIFLGEYYLASKDRSVLPALKILVDNLVAGQGHSGGWGHSPAIQGQTLGYGEVNSVGLACFMTMALAKECRVKVPAEPYERASKYFARYVGTGSMPYGDHDPGRSYSANGKNGGAAVALMLSGNHEGADFFARMTGESAADRERGHTGNYFSYLWGPLAVSLAGDQQLVEFLKPQQWYYDLARHWQGGFITQPWPHKVEGPRGITNYAKKGVSACTPSFGLTYAAPERKLRIMQKFSKR